AHNVYYVKCTRTIKRHVKAAGFVHAKKLLAHKFDPFPAMTLSEFCLFAPAYPAHDYTQHTPRRHKKTGHCDRFVA
ncbi:hypothetical protein, partial [Salmonella enterica]|uniref:hypothetical protein n=1 Tax=Salmonella enterica TaxID=28901 RepID=UPI00325FA456